MRRISPAEELNEAYNTVQGELTAVIRGLREKQAQMTPAELKKHLSQIGLDEVAAADFLASDGTVENMTTQMWVYFESLLKPRPLRTA